MIRSTHIQITALLAGVLLLGGVSQAATNPGPRGADAYDGDTPRVRAELLVDAAELQPGQPVRVGVLFEMDPDWHVYWRNSGESGLPTELTWQAAGLRVGEIEWPVPEVFEESDGFLTTYGYAGEVLLASEAAVSPMASGRVRIDVVADFVTCHIGCIPGRIELRRELPVGQGAPAAADVQARFAEWQARLPRSPGELGLEVDARWSQTGVRPGDDFRGALEVSCAPGASASCEGLYLAAARGKDAFLPEAVPTLELEAVAQQPREAGGFELVLAGHASPDDPGRFEQRVRGLVPVAFVPGDDPKYVQVDVPLPRAFAGEAVAPTEDPAWSAVGGFALPEPPMSLAYALVLAFLGGLILNLMPCVLPILAIKVFHVAEMAHESRQNVLGHGVAYTVGVLASMWALATVVVGLRAAGTAVGWGFQFQEPVFIAAIATVLVVFALNLFGVFEVSFQPRAAARLGAESSGLRRSFFEGLLAVVLATPCTAPFLGTAVGFAFASTPAVIFAMFGAIGLGLAGPYAATTLVPTWARFIPRPGPWMARVRRALGFSLVATVVWLMWVMGRSVGVDAQAFVLAYLVAVAFAVWIFGAVQSSGGRRWVVATGLACVAGTVLALGMLPLERAGIAPRRALARASAPESGPASISWQPWDPAAVRGELARGRPVFVDFTADWCITCKVNEAVVLDSKRVRTEFERLGVATFKADWTLYDEDIRRVLASHGKAGVPMYLVYAPGAPASPAVLPELLTVDIVVDALRDAARDPAAAMNAPQEPAAPAVAVKEERS